MRLTKYCGGVDPSVVRRHLQSCREAMQAIVGEPSHSDGKRILLIRVEEPLEVVEKGRDGTRRCPFRPSDEL